MTARYAVLAAAAAFGLPGSASAADVAVDQPCYVEGGPITATGSGYTPSSTATLSLDGTMSTAGTDVDGAFSTTLTAPLTALKHKGARQFSLTASDASGATASTTINVAAVGIDAIPSRSRPHKRITWIVVGYPSTKVMYGHWRFGGRTRANHRMSVPKGPCGVMRARARQIEAKRIRFGVWTVQFDFNRRYDKHASPRIRVPVRVVHRFS
jgi:hypothetical protein